jgi:hypothetical protein
MGKAAGKRHRRHVDGGHLSGEHRLDLIARLDALDDGEHEIDPVFVRGGTMRSCVDKLVGQSVKKVAVSRTNCFQQ